MAAAINTKNGQVDIGRLFWLATVFWTLAVGAVLSWGVVNARYHAIELARYRARAGLGDDWIYGKWVSMHGGTHLVVTDRMPVNPYLYRVLKHDANIPADGILTVAPPLSTSMLLRWPLAEQDGAKIRLTAFKPTNSENAPDQWEAEALRNIIGGQEEIGSLDRFDGQDYYRTMRPIVAEKRCVTCHRDSGLKAGDVCGGASIAVPMAPFSLLMWKDIIVLVIGKCLLWIIGLIGIVAASRRLTEYDRNRSNAEAALGRNQRRLEEINSCLMTFSTDYDSNISSLTSVCGEQLAAACAVYSRLEEGMLCAVGKWNTPADFKSIDRAQGHICHDVWQEAKDASFVIRDLPNTAYAASDPNVKAYGLRTYIGHVVKCDSKPVGVLCAVYHYDYEPTQDDRRIMGLLASAIGNEEEHKEAAKLLTEKESLVHTVIEMLPVGVWVIDKTGRAIHGNAAGKKIWGGANYASIEQFGERKGRRLDTGKQIEPEQWAAARAISKAEASLNEEIEIDCFDGTNKIILNSAIPILDEREDVQGAVIVNEDITERKRTEERIHRQNAILEGISRIFRECLTCETVEQVGRCCLTIVEEVTGSRFGFIGEINAETGCLDDIAISDPGWEVCRMHVQSGHGSTIPTGFKIHGIYGRVLLDGKGFFTNDPASHPDSIGTPEGHPTLRAFLGVPLIQGGKTFGIVAVGNREGGYRDEDLTALESLAEPIVQMLMRKRAEQAIVQSVSLLRATLESTADGILVVDGEGGISDYNERFVQMWKIPRTILDSRVDRQVLDFVLDQLKEPQQFLSKVQQLYSHPEAESFDTLEFKDGRVFERFSTSQMIDNKSVGRVWSFRDVTERKRMEDAIERDAFMRESLLENLPCIAMILKKGTREIIYSNKVGRDAGAVPGKLCHQIYMGNEEPCPFCLAPEVWENNTIRQLEFEYGGKWYEGRWATLDDDLYVHYIFDFTERKQAEQEIRKLNEELERRVAERTEQLTGANTQLMREIEEHSRAEENIKSLNKQMEFILGATKTGLDIIDSKFNVLYVDPEWRKVYGDPSEQKCYEYFMGRDRTCNDCGMIEAMRTKKMVVTEQVQARENDRPVQVTTIPYQDEQGNWLFAEISVDITDRKKLEKEILSISEREQQRIGRVLHDSLGQQLTGISFMAKVLEKKVVSKSPIFVADVIRITELISHAIEIARGISRGLYYAELETEGLMVAMEELALNTERVFGIKCRFDCPRQLFVKNTMLSVNVYRIAEESITNAIKHGNAENIEVRLICEGEAAVLTIKSDGMPFTGRKKDGKGMGLQIMNLRAKMIDGMLAIERGADGGTVVTCTFPFKNDNQ